MTRKEAYLWLACLASTSLRGMFNWLIAPLTGANHKGEIAVYTVIRTRPIAETPSFPNFPDFDASLRSTRCFYGAVLNYVASVPLRKQNRKVRLKFVGHQ